GFNLRTFLVVVPRSDQKEWHRVFGIVIVMEDLERVFKGLSAASIHVAVEAPGRFGVIEPRPDRSHNYFSGTRCHFFIKRVQIILAPVAAVRLPAMAGMHPCVVSVKIFGVLLW